MMEGKNYGKFKCSSSFEELSVEEMEAIQGSGDVQAETTPVCAVAATAAASSACWLGWWRYFTE